MTQTQSQHAPIAIAGLAHIGIRVHDLDRSVRFYELFGFKKTAGPIGPEPVAIELGTAALTYDQMAEDTNALLDHLKLGQVKVLGWSDGGIIGLILTIHHPEKVAMLAAMGANLQPDAAYPWAVNGVVRERSNRCATRRRQESETSRTGTATARLVRQSTTHPTERSDQNQSPDVGDGR